MAPNSALLRISLRAIFFWFVGMNVAFIFHHFIISQSNDEDTQFNKIITVDNVRWRKQSAIENINTPDTVRLLVLIFSQPHSFHLRQTIRETWLSHSMTDILHVFIISTFPKNDYQLSMETHKYNDTLFITDLDKTDSYTSTQLLLALTWALNHVHFRYVLKCNDASYVSIHRLMKAIPKGPWLVWGYFVGNENVSRTGLKAERTWNLCTTYLPYVQGGGYVISRDIVKHVVQLGHYLDHTDHEDIGLGVWLSPLKILTRLHDIRFNTGPISRGCLNHYIISHPETINSMLNKHALINKGQLCHEEKEIIPSYLYNWTASITGCCK